MSETIDLSKETRSIRIGMTADDDNERVEI